MTTETVVKRRPGRPKGSKNKPKITTEAPATVTATEAPAPVTATETAPVKRGPGRPRKNPMDVAPPAKRGPGRPKGSKNKPKTTESTAAATSPTAPAKRGPGRPRKNPVDVLIPAKRGPGRPKGSKNKPKTTEAPAAVTTATAPVAKRGPGRPRKNPESTATPTITSASRSTTKANSNMRQVLVNPFKAGDVVNIPAGSSFTSAAPTLKGRQKVKRGHKITVIGSIPAHVQPRNSETGSKVLIRPSRIRAKGSGNYWKDITLTEKILRFNGLNPTYETVNVEAAAGSAVAEEPNATVRASQQTASAENEETKFSAHEPMFSANM